ncbi:MAG: hypothetical protein IJ642_10460, partial [Oscillospiraceae bacterium]|nr:hypothetical protein [Oscillospiraceae bacterium]
MKKSFLNRAMAAAIAVPVALSQTVLFASFAEDKVPVTNVIDVNTFVNVPVEDSKASPITEVTKYAVYEKESTWNQSLRTALNSLDGTVQELDTDALFSQFGRFSDKWYTEIVKGAASATAEVSGTDVILTLDVAFTQAEKDILENKVADMIISQDSAVNKEDLKKDITSNVLDTAKAKVVITVDTTSLDSDEAVSYKVTATTDTGNITTLEEAQAYLESKIEAYRKELKATAEKLFSQYEAQAADAEVKFEDAAGQLKTAETNLADADAALTEAERTGIDVAAKRAEYNQKKAEYDNKKAEYDSKYADYQDKLAKLRSAEKLVDTKIDEFIDNSLSKIDKYETKAENALDKNVTVSYTGANYNEVLKKAQDAADARTSDTSRAGKAVNKIPETVSELLDKNVVVKAYTEVLRQLNNVANTKGYEVAITTDDIADIVNQAYDVTFDATYSDAAADGTTTCLLPDDLDDLSYYYTYFNDLLKADGITDKEVDTITTEKKIELSGNADYNTLDGEGTLSVKRIIYVTLKDVEETESDTDKTSESESDKTSESESDKTSESESDKTSESESSTDPYESESESDTDKTSESESDTDKTSESESDTDKTSESESSTDPYESESESDT